MPNSQTHSLSHSHKQLQSVLFRDLRCTRTPLMPRQATAIFPGEFVVQWNWRPGGNKRHREHPPFSAASDGILPSIPHGDGVTLASMDHCSRPLTSDSQARALKAEQDGKLPTLAGELRCECGAHVGAVRKPHLDGPKGGPLHPTLHYPDKPTRSPARKRNPFPKSPRR